MASFFIICFATGLVLSLLSLMSGFGHLHIGHFHVGHHHMGHAGHGAWTARRHLVGECVHGAGVCDVVRRRRLPADAFGDASTNQIVVLLASLGWIRWRGSAVDGALQGPAAARARDGCGRHADGWRGRPRDATESAAADGIGEIIFSQTGARRASAARSDDGRAIERGAEVVVIRYERGVAYVRRWDELAHPDA